MSGLKDRLARFKRTDAKRADEGLEREADVENAGELGGGSGKAADSADRAVVAALSAPLPLLDARWERLGVRLQGDEAAAFLLRECRYEAEFAHGTHRLSELDERRTGLLRRMTNEEAIERGFGGGETEISSLLERLLFLDTETTGLGVGAGNVSFMIGIGLYEAGQFVVRQLFIRNPAEETAMLAYLQETMQTRDRLVTFNGKCFDWPIIKNRFILNRLRRSGPEPIHLDLLFPSRSVWKRSLPSCRLTMLEQARLGLNRVDDVPGSLAPTLYFQYLAEGDPGVMAGVFEHNERDVLTLATLAIHFTKLLEGSIPVEALEEDEAMRLALWFEKLGEESKAVAAVDALVARLDELSADNALLCAAFYKRRQQVSRAAAIWQRLVEEGSRSTLANVEPWLELAMHYEHRERDLPAALRLAEEALARTRSRMALARGGGKHAQLCEQLQQRIARLRKKAAAPSVPAASHAAAPSASAASRVAAEAERAGATGGSQAEVATVRADARPPQRAAAAAGSKGRRSGAKAASATIELLL
ncbi:ribonuclease H-like domain-containing protein [Paenibacillus koleovorans]|uniref:ribonuclease H-like domain-containing protein n=1 Tax=Paenibacillus koleovorans TaxID=121608 RepID=UPI000FD70D9B|nr:ribonuclease H-like domain-containing protein [Paenibacillus koleovorans]